MADLREAGPSGANLLNASEAREALAEGDMTSEALVRDCLDRIETRDPEIGAWAYVGPLHAVEQARARDGERPVRPLHGIPIGVKDVLDTVDMPTEYGSVIHKGHRPAADSTIVAELRKAGAVILGKTRTTEFACPVPVGVKNPHDFGRSPGVSSSGSAAAVADFMVPIALGTQTGGSVILPAAFCGLVGYKASLDGMDRGGIRHLRTGLDTLGAMARSVADIWLLRNALFHARTPKETLMTPEGSRQSYRFLRGPYPDFLLDDVERLPRVGLCRTPYWDQAAPETVAAIESAAGELVKTGAEIIDVDWPGSFAGIEDTFRVISTVEGLRALEIEHRDHADQLNEWILEGAEFARGCPADDARAAQRHAETCRADLAEVFSNVDFILTPSTVGEASDDLTGISNSCFNRIWTLMHGPCVTLPAYSGPNGLPVGVQLVGPVGGDDDLLSMAQWVWDHIIPFDETKVVPLRPEPHS